MAVYLGSWWPEILHHHSGKDPPIGEEGGYVTYDATGYFDHAQGPPTVRTVSSPTGNGVTRVDIGED